ncbi:MAG: hypothetical protein HQL93_14060, partial [Magnetococcales bacterium]|nr:hypothetical protein [Magnetococcales bacterium]
MNPLPRQQGSFVVMAMFLLAGVTVVGVSLANWHVSGLDGVAAFRMGNKSLGLAESGVLIGFKQLKDAGCDPGMISGARDGEKDGVVVTRSLGEAGSVDLDFCPMGGECFKKEWMPTDEDVALAEEENDDALGVYHSYWTFKHGKQGKFLEWIAKKKHYR